MALKIEFIGYLFKNYSTISTKLSGTAPADRLNVLQIDFPLLFENHVNPTLYNKPVVNSLPLFIRIGKPHVEVPEHLRHHLINFLKY